MWGLPSNGGEARVGGAESGSIFRKTAMGMSQKKSNVRSGQCPDRVRSLGKSRRGRSSGLEIVKRRPLSPKIFWAGCILISLVAWGMGRSGEAIPASELQGKGDLFYRQGETEPFTGTAVTQVGGKKTEAEFWQGRMHGAYRSWFANGQMEGEAYFEKGVREGRARLWNKDGQMIRETRFREGLPDGPATEWYPNGTMERRTSWRAGKRHGEVETWFASGKRKGVGNYDQGERSGTFVVWWESGKKRQETNYKKGVPTGWWVEWKENGEPEKKAYFVNGKATSGPAQGEP
ncbi:MAG: toxin-antitoxin system YwqK family antitoxin [Proteobacteria bacterium]|nr:toxin-antitoxin system YwqK family antitoxin [Pseudomonadota bacterium]NBS06305.1 toxin-antitoxin system YwqK family antitoxin [Verrucomicrobiota bacterium]